MSSAFRRAIEAELKRLRLADPLAYRRLHALAAPLFNDEEGERPMAEPPRKTGKDRKTSRHAMRLGNRAEPTGQPPAEGHGQCCDNHLLFAMRDKHHEFTLGIKTILECLLTAEEQGVVPELPADWWNQVMNRYQLERMRFQEGNKSPRTS